MTKTISNQETYENECKRRKPTPLLITRKQLIKALRAIK